MTFNIWNYQRSWPERRIAIAHAITLHQPDIVALQETRHDFRYEHGKGQGEQLADMLGYHCQWALGQVYIPFLRVDEGVSTLSRVPFAGYTVKQLTLLPHERGDENHRVCLEVRVPLDGRTVHIFNTHFSLSERARQSNAREVVAFIRTQAGGEPAVLMGDLNALPNTPEMEFLRGDAYLGEETGDLTDCWLSAHPDLPGYTYASWDAVRRIDYVYGRNIGRVRSAEVVGAEPFNGVYSSDHMGIVMEIEFA